jgi:NitT/TauT family transport system ATP-binding protein
MLEFDRVHFSFGDAPVLAGVSLRVDPGEFVVLLGPSGCGKTSLLRMAAGMLRPSGGRLSQEAMRRGFVFQEPRLAPWLSAIDNVAFGLKAIGASAAKRRAVARNLLLRLGFDQSDLRKRPAALSGGMAQRVAIARALAIEPQLLLMDEPFAALDVGLRRRLQDLVCTETARARVTTLFVTHDVAEAVRLASRIVVLSPRPARIVADLTNAPVADPALIHEAAAALLRRREVAAALFPVSDAPLGGADEPPSNAAARNCLRCDRCECLSA